MVLNLKHFPAMEAGGVSLSPVLFGGRRCLSVSVKGSGVSAVMWPKTDGSGWEQLEVYVEAKAVGEGEEDVIKELEELLAQPVG